MTLTIDACRARDRADPLRALRGLFALPAGVIYLDGNSLGPLPRATPERIRRAVESEWGEGLIRSWNTEGWFELPRRVGDRIAPLVGARPGELVAADGTTINLYKALSVAMSLVEARAPGRRRMVSEASNFPTDLYVAEALCRERGWPLELVESGDIASALAEDVGILALTHVNYRTGAMHDMAAMTAAAHAAGALCVWDLAHSAGAVPVDLHAADADFAVGCGYKYLNGGPGAPGFVWVHPRHVERFCQPLCGWWGHAAPFEFSPEYRPAPGIARYLCGSQPVLQMLALECGVETLAAAAPLGGMPALRAKSLALTDLFIALVEERCAGHGLALVTPREHAQRGSQVCLTRAEGGYAIVQALIARGVIGDFRAGDGARQPDILRFGFTPLTLGFEDVWNAAGHLREVLASGEWREARFSERRAIT